MSNELEKYKEHLGTYKKMLLDKIRMTNEK